MVSGIGMSAKIVNKKVFCFLQIIDIHGNMFNFHFCLHYILFLYLAIHTAGAEHCRETASIIISAPHSLLDKSTFLELRIGQNRIVS